MASLVSRHEPKTAQTSASEDRQNTTMRTQAVHEMMVGASAMMKEEDAATLERGVGNSCSPGPTPILSPIPTPQTKGFELMEDLTNCVENVDLMTTRTARFESDSCNERISPRSPRSIASASHDKESPHQERGQQGRIIRRPLFRRCLSGEVRPLVSFDSQSAMEPSSETRPIGTRESLSCCLPGQSAHKEGTGMKVRSPSFDRRLNEAVQFAEAVGELPPTHQDEVRVIIEESGSEYDDDSDDEVLVDETSAEESPNDTCAGSRTDEAEAADTKEERTSWPAVFETPRRKSRPRWPFNYSISTSSSFLHKLPEGTTPPDFAYKGICSNPPEITKRGVSRGNYAQLHRKAWLEVSDKYHRYGKNLRMYYRYWERLGFPTNKFFDWLDSKGEAAGQPLPNLPECPRSQLDSDTVLYITNPAVTRGYALDIAPDEKGRGLVVDVDGDPVCTGPDGWMFVLRDNTLYGAEKITSVTGQSKQRFHHSSFFRGKAVAAAGIILTDENGVLTRLYPHSGHYRPGEADVQRMLFHLHDKGVDMRSFHVDMQQIVHVTRHELPSKTGQGSDEGAEKKKKKVQSLHLKLAVYVAWFLGHKARYIRAGLFDQIHSIRKVDVATVMEALDVVDDGGFWKKIRSEFRAQLP